METTFDGASRLLKTIEHLRLVGDGTKSIVAQIVTTRTLDANGRLTKLKDANDNETSFAYDTLDRLTTITFPDTKTRVTTYNKASDVTAFTDEALTTFTYTLDALGRTTAVQIGGSTLKSFQYDGLSRNTRAVDHMTETAVTVDFYYDSLGRVVEEVSPYFVTQTEFTSYPATECTYPDGRVVDSFYDVLYRRNVVSQPGAGGSAADIAEWRFYGVRSANPMISAAIQGNPRAIYRDSVN